MIKADWKRALLWVLVGWTFAALGLPHVSVLGRAQQQTSAINSPLYLPGHHYDLPATRITAAEIEATKQKMIAAGQIDVPVKMVKSGGSNSRYQIGVSVSLKPQGLELNRDTFAIHDDVAEVYYLLEGDTVMQLGGTPKDGKRRPLSAGNGMGITGTMLEGAQEMRLTKGDALIIPAGTPHKFKTVTEFTSYVIVRMDPDGVAALK